MDEFVANEALASPGGLSIAFDDSKDVSGWEEMISSGNYLKMDRSRKKHRRSWARKFLWNRIFV